MSVTEAGGLTLAKLSIKAYRDREMTRDNVFGSMDALYNPQTVELSWSTYYDDDVFVNKKQQRKRYRQLQPGMLRLNLVFDATLPENRNRPIDQQLSLLRSLCSVVDAKTGETHFLRLTWGKMIWSGRGYFAGRMTELSIRYTMFDRDGTPLRASATLGVVADESLRLQQAEMESKAPLVRISTIQALDTLPLLAAQAGMITAGTTVDYLDLAYANDLDNLRAVQPGMQLAVAAGSVGT